MNDYRHIDELSELATSRIRWIIACFTTMALLWLTLILAWLEVI
jgi:hypothetical protein